MILFLGSIKNWIVKFLIKNKLNKLIKTGLDKLPANGKKTAITFSIALVTAIISAVGADGGFIVEVSKTILDSLKALPHGEVNEAQAVIATNIVAGAVFLYHKILKLVFNND